MPEDRSLWPSFLSGGLLPPPDPANIIHDGRTTTKARASSASLDHSIAYPTSSSVPAPSFLSSSIGTSSASGPGSGAATSTGRSPSAGPRMHDYAIPTSGGITQVRPGVVGVPTVSSSQPDIHVIPVRTSSSLNNPAHVVSGPQHSSAPVPVPVGREMYREPHPDGAYSFVSGASVSDAWSSPVSVGFAQSSFRSSAGSAAYSAPGFGRSLSEGAGGWSLPRSLLRSDSRSRSRSGSVDMCSDERERELGDVEYVDVDGMDGEAAVGGGGRFGFTSRAWKSQIGNGKIDEEEWDGMEMEMEM